MIKANEIRLANYFSTPNQPIFRIDVIDILTNNYAKVGQYINEQGHPLTWYLSDLQPIPLTEEWLLKLGFECIADCIDQKTFALKNRKSNYYYAVILDHEEIVLERKDINGYYTIIWDERYFQYVHQLQNLYFALTGEELKLK